MVEQTGKVVVVSGGSSGIGLAIAKRFAADGARVAIFGRKQPKLDAAVAEIGASASSYSLDVRDADAVRAAYDAIGTAEGGIDVVVAAAAGNFFAPADKITPNGFKTVVDIDLVGTFHVFSLALPRLRKPGASLLAVTAPQAQRAMPLQAHACAAKAGVDMLVKCLALEWGALGVRVNAVSPGPIDGTEGLARLAASPEVGAFVRDATALKRFGATDDIAEAAAYLCGPRAGYVTGTILDCDGGMRLGNVYTP